MKKLQANCQVWGWISS